MNVVFLMLSAVSAGADPAPYTPPVVTAPAVYPVAEAEPEHAEKPGFFARLRDLFRGHKSAPEEVVASGPGSTGGCACGAAVAAGRIAPMPTAGTHLPTYTEPTTVYGPTTTMPVPAKPEPMRMPRGEPDSKVSTVPGLNPTGAVIEADGKNPY